MFKKLDCRTTMFALFSLIALVVSGLFAPIASAAVNTTTYGGFALRDNATGGDCTAVGSWNSGAKRCILTNDINVGVNNGNGVVIFDNGITLDGSGHTITGTSTSQGSGVYILGGNTEVKNLTITNFSSAIHEGSSGANNVISGNTIGSMNSIGILLSGQNAKVSNNQVLSSYGIRLEAGGKGALISGNHTKSMTIGIYINSSKNNTIVNNTVELPENAGSQTSGVVFYYSSDNLTYNNNFVKPYGWGALVSSQFSSGNRFNLPAPIGGNYWSTWASPDANNDGFVDSPYNFGAAQDDLPYTLANGWCSKPDLTLSKNSVFWASYADYQARQLSVSWTINNSGRPAYNVQLTRSTNTNGVSLITPSPLTLGDIAGGGSSTSVFIYDVPAGVSGFSVMIESSAQDACGNSYPYPR